MSTLTHPEEQVAICATCGKPQSGHCTPMTLGQATARVAEMAHHRTDPITGTADAPPSEDGISLADYEAQCDAGWRSQLCPKCGNFRGHTVRCYDQTEKDRVFRNAVLEEAVRVCEEEAALNAAAGWSGRNEGAHQCANRIQALKVSPLEKTEVQP
jgi:hypothetical protein